MSGPIDPQAAEGVRDAWTPRPWEWDYSPTGIDILSGDDIIAEINGDCPAAKADARLIAAAPELVEALRACADYQDGAVDRARALLRKIEGGDQ